MLIQADMSQAPDVRLIIPANFYDAQILAIEDKPPSKPETKGTVLHIQMRINKPEAPDVHGREITGYGFIPADLTRKDALTPVKRIFLSAGLPIDPRGMDTRNLIGRVVKIRVDNGIDKDPRTGVQKEFSSVGDFMIPGEVMQMQGAVGNPAAHYAPPPPNGGAPGQFVPPVQQQAPQQFAPPPQQMQQPQQQQVPPQPGAPTFQM
jgi:hypothetical protein